MTNRGDVLKGMIGRRWRVPRGGRDEKKMEEISRFGFIIRSAKDL